MKILATLLGIGVVALGCIVLASGARLGGRSRALVLQGVVAAPLGAVMVMVAPEPLTC